jgi:hypothetical protein
MLGQLDLGDHTSKPNVIGNATQHEKVLLINLNSGKTKKMGQGAYDLEMRSNLPKMPRMTQKHEQVNLEETVAAMGFSYKLAKNIEQKRCNAEIGEGRSG